MLPNASSPLLRAAEEGGPPQEQLGRRSTAWEAEKLKGGSSQAEGAQPEQAPALAPALDPIEEQQQKLEELEQELEGLLVRWGAAAATAES